MIIGVDAGCLGVVDKRLKTGVYYYTCSLLKNLTQVDKKNQYLLYSFIPIEKRLLYQFGSNVENQVLRPQKGWLNLRLSLEFLLNKPDLFLGLSQALPFFHPLKSIVFIHDLAFEHYPGCYKDSYFRLFRQTRFAVQQGDKIVAVSSSTKNDLIGIYHTDEKKIEVIYHGVDPIFTPKKEKEIRQVKTKYHLSDPYFLSVGSLKPIKNIPRVIKAFALFLRRVTKKNKLVLVGSDYWLDEKIKETIKRVKLTKEIVTLGFIPREDLPALYSSAEAFVTPSLYEGFGLPILEAMASGTPVITGNTGSMPEVAGSAALLVDPLNTKEISQALYNIHQDINLVSELRKKGLERVKKFSWEKTAIRVLKLMNTINMDPESSLG